MPLKDDKSIICSVLELKSKIRFQIYLACLQISIFHDWFQKKSISRNLTQIIDDRTLNGKFSTQKT